MTRKKGPRGRGVEGPREESSAGPAAAAVAATVVLGVMRVYSADRLGFGDAEALYACYARHPQAVYLDHPGLIGVFERVVGGATRRHRKRRTTRRRSWR